MKKTSFYPDMTLKPFHKRMTDRYEDSKQIVVYVDSRMYERLLAKFSGVSHAVIVGSLLDRAFGEKFTEKHKMVWPRNAKPFRIIRQEMARETAKVLTEGDEKSILPAKEAIVSTDYRQDPADSLPSVSVPAFGARHAAEPRPLSTSSLTRRGRIALTAWFPTEITEHALRLAKEGQNKYRDCGNTLHRVMLNCAADLCGMPLWINRHPTQTKRTVQKRIQKVF